MWENQFHKFNLKFYFQVPQSLTLSYPVDSWKHGSWCQPQQSKKVHSNFALEVPLVPHVQIEPPLNQIVWYYTALFNEFFKSYVIVDQGSSNPCCSRVTCSILDKLYLKTMTNTNKHRDTHTHHRQIHLCYWGLSLTDLKLDQEHLHHFCLRLECFLINGRATT